MGSHEKGSRRERELANELDDKGFAVMRAPSSGSATERDLPDVFAGNGLTFVAIEVKASSGDHIYIDEAEVDALAWFAEQFTAAPLLGIRFDYCDWKFFEPANTYRTDGGNYRVTQATAEAHAFDLDALTASPPNHYDTTNDTWT